MKKIFLSFMLVTSVNVFTSQNSGTVWSREQNAAYSAYTNQQNRLHEEALKEKREAEKTSKPIVLGQPLPPQL